MDHGGCKQVIDVDYHSGNGSLAIHWDDPTVFFASLHMDPEVDYPYCAGFPDQVGPGYQLYAWLCTSKGQTLGT